MATRVTRRTMRQTVECVQEIETTSSQSSRRRQRKKSESSEKGDASCRAETVIDLMNVTPPKIGKFTKNPDSKYSPSTLINRLQLVESEIDEVAEEPKSQPKTKIDGARKVLNVGETERLYGREKELAELSEFLETNVIKKTSASMYISGQPGTGKTACVRQMLRPSSLSNKFKKVYINCTSIQTPAAIFKAICIELGLKAASDKETNLNNIHSYICSRSNKMVLLVLDEIDELIEKKQSVLYTIFEWPMLPKARIILIGIANSLDLTNRALARLQTQSIAVKPKLVHFTPYTKQQIIDIFKNRLEEAGVLDTFPLPAIQFLSAKVAAMSGDVRKALDIGRRVAELAKQQSDVENIDLNELGVAMISDTPKVEKVEMKQVLNVLNSVYSTANTVDDNSVDTFPLQQKILVCTLLLMLKSAKNKDITVSRLHSVYVKVCQKRGIPSIDESEFIGMCSLTETKGIIRMIKNKVPRLTKIQLQWDQDEITRTIHDKQLIAQILSDNSVLDK